MMLLDAVTFELQSLQHIAILIRFNHTIPNTFSPFPLAIYSILDPILHTDDGRR